MRDLSIRRVIGAAAIGAAALGSGCATAPPARPARATIAFEQKIAWMLQLEDRRVLRIESPVPAPATTPVVRGRKQPTPAAVPPPAVSQDLTVLVTDPEARVRRRAAMAIGRVGLREGIQPLTVALGDSDPDVREMAAFALGLIGHGSAAAPLTTALTDGSTIVRGRAAEALGLIALAEPPQLDAPAKKSAADAISRMAAEFARSPVLAGIGPDDDRWPAAPEAEAFRLGIYALVRLHAYEQLAGTVLAANGQRVTTWWPVTYALGRIEDKRAQPALLAALAGPGKYSVAFAARGLGVLKDPASVGPLSSLIAAASTPPEVVVSAVRAVASIGDTRAAAALVKLAEDSNDPNVKLEAVTALGVLHASEGLPIVQDFLTDPWPSMRAAAVRAAAAIDPERFVLVLSGMEPDPQWTVRAALAEALATLPPGVALERVRSMLRDDDRRVIPAVLSALVRLKAPDVVSVLLAQLKEPDFVVRATAARLIGELKPGGGAEAVRYALKLAQADAAIVARAAIL